MLKRLTSVFFIALMLPGLAQAQRYDTNRLFTRGAWYVDLVYDTQDRSYWCNASTINRKNQEFSVTGFDDGSLSIFIFDDDWNLTREDITFRIDVDRSGWTVYGLAEGVGVSAELDDASKAADFLADVAAGNVVRVLTQNGKGIATFSLHGSRAALNALLDCWEGIS